MLSEHFRFHPKCLATARVQDMSQVRCYIFYFVNLYLINGGFSLLINDQIIYYIKIEKILFIKFDIQYM